MIRKVQPFLWLLLLMIATAGTGFAAETTGSLSGVVKGAEGAGLGGRGGDGQGRVPARRPHGGDGQGGRLQLPAPAAGHLPAERRGAGYGQRPARGRWWRSTGTPRWSWRSSPGWTEEITVNAALPLIDVKSTEAQVNFTSEEIENLPVPRNYKGLFELAPGVPDNGRLAPNAGGSRMDNLFLVDGINVTNPDFGDIFPDLTELDIKEVSIVRGGITAEFGRTGGMVVNAITKSGTNQLQRRGAGRVPAVELRGREQERDRAEHRGQELRRRLARRPDRARPALVLRLGEPPLGHAHRPAQQPRLDPGPEDDDQGVLRQADRQPDLEPVPHRLAALAGHLVRRRRTSPRPRLRAWGPTTRKKYLLGTASWTWNLTADSFVEAKYNHDKEENSTSPFTDLGYKPAFNAARPDLVGQFTTTPDFLVGGATGVGQTVGGAVLAINNQDFTRDEATGDLPDVQDLGEHAPRPAGGRHLRGELRAARAARQRLGHGHLERHHAAVHGELHLPAAAAHRPRHLLRRLPPGSDRAQRAADASPSACSTTRTTTSASGLGSTPGTKTEGEDPHLRLGPAAPAAARHRLRPQPGSGDKVYFNFGRYYNTENKSLGRAASPDPDLHHPGDLRRGGEPDLRRPRGQHPEQDDRQGARSAVHRRVPARLRAAVRRHLVGRGLGAVPHGRQHL